MTNQWLIAYAVFFALIGIAGLIAALIERRNGHNRNSPAGDPPRGTIDTRPRRRLERGVPE